MNSTPLINGEPIEIGQHYTNAEFPKALYLGVGFYGAQPKSRNLAIIKDIEGVNSLLGVFVVHPDGSPRVENFWNNMRKTKVK